MANPGWTKPDREHKPEVLSDAALHELRLMGLYPNAADLLATVDEYRENARLVARIDAKMGDYWCKQLADAINPDKPATE